MVLEQVLSVKVSPNIYKETNMSRVGYAPQNAGGSGATIVTFVLRKPVVPQAFLDF